MSSYCIVLLLASIFYSCSAFKSYQGSEVWRIEATEVDILNHVLSQFEYLDIWSKSSEHFDVHVGSDRQSLLHDQLELNGLKYTAIIQDLDEMIQDEHDRLSKAPRSFNSSDYNTFEDVEVFLKSVAANNPLASLNSIGLTNETRNLWVLTFSTGAGKPSVWIDCGIHAREWLSQSTCLWGIEHINDTYNIDPDVTALLNAYDVNIMPVYNPDGYSYCWTDDRLWRKNRKLYPENSCVGTDLNRNFDNHFAGEGTSNDSCSDIYCGPSPASELETQAVVDTFNTMMGGGMLRFFMSIHTYSQLWMYPYGWTHTLVPDNDEIDRVAEIGVNALMSVYNTTYERGSISNAIYIDSGSSTDWTYEQGLVHTHTLELRPKRALVGGFVQDPSLIVPVAIETWTGIMAAIAALP